MATITINQLEDIEDLIDSVEVHSILIHKGFLFHDIVGSFDMYANESETVEAITIFPIKPGTTLYSQHGYNTSIVTAVVLAG